MNVELDYILGIDTTLLFGPSKYPNVCTMSVKNRECLCSQRTFGHWRCGECDHVRAKCNGGKQVVHCKYFKKHEGGD